MKKENGITLVALVITIIVLLILAGITINLTIGQDGILKRAGEAGKNYTNAADYEQDQLAELTNTTDNIINNFVIGNSNNTNQWDEEIYQKYRLTGYSGNAPTLQDDGKYHYTVTMPYSGDIATATIITDTPKLGGYIENRPYVGYNYKDDMYYIVWGQYVQFYTTDGNPVYRDYQDGRCFKIVDHDEKITYIDIRCDFPVFETKEDLIA